MRENFNLLSLAGATLLAACTITQMSSEPLGDVAYVSTAKLLITEGLPMQVSLRVQGQLPTPCHNFRYQVEIEAGKGNHKVDISIYSDSDPTAACIQELEPFDETIQIPLEQSAEGNYLVYVNDELVGEFRYPD